MSNAIRQIVDAMRFQERAPGGHWVRSEHIPITDLLVAFGDLDQGADSQYVLMVKWDLAEPLT